MTSSPRLSYDVPAYATTPEGAKHLKRRRYSACTEAREGCSIFGDGPFHTMQTTLRFGKHRHLTLATVAQIDPCYIQWLRNLRDATDHALGAQNAILANDMRHNRKVAWRRLLWRWRVHNALWHAAEQGALRRHAYREPDIAGFERDMGINM